MRPSVPYPSDPFSTTKTPCTGLAAMGLAFVSEIGVGSQGFARDVLQGAKQCETFDSNELIIGLTLEKESQIYVDLLAITRSISIHPPAVLVHAD